jgi:hypothetical protein
LVIVTRTTCPAVAFIILYIGIGIVGLAVELNASNLIAPLTKICTLILPLPAIDAPSSVKVFPAVTV